VQRPRLDHQRRRLLLSSLVIGVGLVLIVSGFRSSVTGRKALALPATIENIDPVRGAVGVPAQTEVFVDLLPGYTGELIIDDIRLQTTDIRSIPVTPGQQVTLPATVIYDDARATLTFIPTPDAAITSFTQGTHTAKVIYWKAVDGPTKARSYTWTFSVF
jgi:hypothetical protein